MVVEEFVRKLSLGRWEPAREHLADELAAQVSTDSLQSFLTALEQRIGAVEDVHGEPFFTAGVTAEALAQIRTSDGESAGLRLSLLREQGLWKISRLD
jgi:hypothetical protein